MLFISIKLPYFCAHVAALPKLVNEHEKLLGSETRIAYLDLSNSIRILAPAGSPLAPVVTENV